MANLEGLGRISTALRILAELDSRHPKDSPERERASRLRERLFVQSLRIMEADLDALEQQPQEP
jgi:hypothetical protein